MLWLEYALKQPCEPKVWIFQVSWKNALGKRAVAANTGGHSIRVLNEKSVSDDGNLCPLWLAILKSVWYSVGGTLWLRHSWSWAVVSYKKGKF